MAEDHEAPDFYLLDAQIDLAADSPAIIGDIRAQVRERAPGCVVLDTLNRSLAGSESNDKDMAFYIRAADAICKAFGCAVIVVHHCGVNDSRPRGHTSLTGAADAQLAVRRDAAGNIIVTVEWMKDGAEGDVIASRLERMDIGIDQDGDVQSSCVIVPVEGELPRAVPQRRLSDRQRLAIEALTETVLQAGKPAPPEWQLPAGIQIVGADAWREELMRRSVIDRDGANPRQDFKRLRESLAARKLIGNRDEQVWQV